MKIHRMLLVFPLGVILCSGVQAYRVVLVYHDHTRTQFCVCQRLPTSLEFHLNSFTPPLSQVCRFYLAFTLLRVASRRPVPLHSSGLLTPPNSSCARQYPRSCPTWASMGYGRSVFFFEFLSCDAPKLTILSFSRISFSPPLPTTTSLHSLALTNRFRGAAPHAPYTIGVDVR